MGFILTVGDFSDGLFGGVFPACGLISADNARLVDAADCVVILCKSSPVIIKNALGVIFNGDAPPERLPDGIQLISVGIGAKNAVSISSRAPDRITLSLNRTLRTVSGICEPLELPVTADENAELFDYMAAFAAAVLMGKY